MAAETTIRAQESYDAVARRISNHLGLEYVEPLHACAWQVHLVRSFERQLTLRVGIGERVQSVRNEAAALRRLRGPIVNPPKLHLHEETGEGKTSVGYLLKDYIEGEVLSERGRLPRGYASPLERAVRAAHRQGIAGLDIHEWNILVTPTGARLFDFSEAVERNRVSRRVFEEAKLFDLADLAEINQYFVTPISAEKCFPPADSHN
jgi:hypothetical protein